MKAMELLKLLKPLDDNIELMTCADNPGGVEFDDEPDLPIIDAMYEKKQNVIFFECKTTISRNLEDV